MSPVLRPHCKCCRDKSKQPQDGPLWRKDLKQWKLKAMETKQIEEKAPLPPPQMPACTRKRAINRDSSLQETYLHNKATFVSQIPPLCLPSFPLYPQALPLSLAHVSLLLSFWSFQSLASRRNETNFDFLWFICLMSI